MGKILNVLLVEDNPGDAFLLEEMLEEIPEYEFNFTQADTLKKTISQLQQETYDVILLDLGLPDSKGLNALETVLALDLDSPVVVTTGLKDGSAGQKAIELGAQSYLVKGEFTRHSVFQNILFSIERSKFLKRLKEKEAELKKKNKQLEESNAAQNMMISIISHDLRGPVNSINSLLEITYAEYDQIDDETRKRYLKAILMSAGNTQNLLENLLQWALVQAKRKKVEPVKTDIIALIHQSMDQLELIAKEKEIQMTIAMSDRGHVFADKKMISTVIRNLISNALKFTPRNGKIDLEVKEGESKVQVDIKDTGVGMKQEVVDTLFKNGKTSSTLGTEKEPGSGFGLVLCKEFIEKNNGSISVKSETEKGTQVTFTLPKYE